MKNTPDGIHLVPDFLSAAERQSILDYAELQIGRRALVGQSDPGSGDVRQQVSSAFTAERIELDALHDEIVGLFRRVFREHVEPVYDTSIEWFEFPHLLRYRKGGEYIPHSDSENLDESSGHWVRKIDRDFSVILYLNDTFTGGELYFPDYEYTLRPSPGLLVVFPSNHRFRHQAQPTLSGRRYAMVSWSAAKGTERVAGPPAGAVFS